MRASIRKFQRRDATRCDEAMLDHRSVIAHFDPRGESKKIQNASRGKMSTQPSNVEVRLFSLGCIYNEVAKIFAGA
jgi:hypothetical protein